MFANESGLNLLGFDDEREVLGRRIKEFVDRGGTLRLKHGFQYRQHFDETPVKVRTRLGRNIPALAFGAAVERGPGRAWVLTFRPEVDVEPSGNRSEGNDLVLGMEEYRSLRRALSANPSLQDVLGLRLCPTCKDIHLPDHLCRGLCQVRGVD
jgi:hypothetical protein